jgi:hypothetical protein
VPRVVGLSTGVAVGVLLVLSALSGSLNPFEHISCVTSQAVAEEPERVVPAFVLNSPYGGAGLGEAYGWSSTVRNGSVGAIVLGYANMTLYRTQNATRAGIGPSTPCSVGFRAVMGSSDLYAGGTVWVSSIPLRSDAQEPRSLTIDSWFPGNDSIQFTFNNSFSVSNAPDITTCGGNSTTRSVNGVHMSIGVPFAVDGLTVIAPFALSLTERFTYTFPAEFGTWAIDNLSAHGGPGGGWAFDYLGPCV